LPFSNPACGQGRSEEVAIKLFPAHPPLEAYFVNDRILLLLSPADMIRQLAEMLRRLPPDANKAFKEKVIKATETRLWMPPSSIDSSASSDHWGARGEEDAGVDFLWAGPFLSGSHPSSSSYRCLSGRRCRWSCHRAAFPFNGT
jgi:hypothetical protein